MRKFHQGQDFFPHLILSTDVLSTSTTDSGHRISEMEATFKEDRSKMRETCIEYPSMKLELRQGNGSKVDNIISRDDRGELFLTFAFEWSLCDPQGTASADQELQRKKLAQLAVELTLRVARQMVQDGRIV